MLGKFWGPWYGKEKIRKHGWKILYIPHASEELDQTSVSKGEGDGNVGRSHAASVEVDARKDERGKGEGRETEGCRVGELSVLIRLP